MVFSSSIFIFGFLPAVILCYYLQKPLARIHLANATLLGFSYFFYLYGAGEVLLILVASTVADYLIARLIDRSRRGRQLWLAVSVLMNIGLLGYYKYANFAITEFNGVLMRWGIDSISWHEVFLPVGISFFTFQKLSYVIDVHRRQLRAETHIVDFALYVAMFPQLVAGPIVRYLDLCPQLKENRESWERFYSGTLRFIWGLAKKLLLADACGQIADAAFGLPPALLDTKTAWLGAVAYTLQIYFDFSAYADMAIGLGLLFGFRLPENFNRPYSAVSITDFWRRWHMTLSRWFRDYVYIPLGGNRKGGLRTCVNLVVVCTLCGIWHGANWTFVVWGLYHGVLLVLERIGGIYRLADEDYRIRRRALTLFLVIVGWVLFRADDIPHAMRYLTVMFNATDLPFSYDVIRVLDYRNLSCMALAMLAFFLPARFSGISVFTVDRNPAPLLAGVVLILMVLPYCAALLVEDSAATFIYYRF